jgi:alanine dehydrogenase
MRIGVPKEIKSNEHRVGLIPAAVRELTAQGHEVLIEAGAGAGSGFPDATYLEAGATLAPDAEAVFSGADLIV